MKKQRMQLFVCYCLVKICNLYTFLAITNDYSFFIRIILTLADLYVADLLGNDNYLIYNVFTPVNVGSFENLLFVLRGRCMGISREIIDFILSLFNVYNTNNFNYIYKYKHMIDDHNVVQSLCKFRKVAAAFKNDNYIVTYHVRPFDYSFVEHLPCLNASWFVHVNMDQQFYKLIRHLYLILNCLIQSIDCKISLLFKPSVTFTNYLLYIHNSSYINLYFTFYLVFTYLLENFKYGRIVGTNFLMWPSFIFSLLYIFDNKH